MFPPRRFQCYTSRDVLEGCEWLGGQFSSEGLVAIDENRGPKGYGHGVPMPRHGLFKEAITRIEQINEKKYGVARPGKPVGTNRQKRNDQ